MLAPVCSAIHFWLQPSVKHADENVTGIVEWSLPNLQHTQHGLKSTSELRLMEQGLIGTGFAYTEYSSVSPGAWYQHSWGLDYSTKTPRVIETTHKFKDYYGVELDNEECKCFVLQNVLPMTESFQLAGWLRGEEW